MTSAEVDPVLAALCRALGGAGSGALLAHLDERSVLHLPGGSGLAGDYRGGDAVAGVLDRMARVVDGLRFEQSAAPALHSGGSTASGTLRGRRGMRALAAPITVRAESVGVMIRDARISCPDPPAWDAFWS